MAKLTKIEDIINELVRMKVEKGTSNKTMLDYIYNTYGYKQTYAYELIKKARIKIQEIWDKNAEFHLEESKGQLETLLEIAMKNKDLRLALQIRQEINKLMGLYTERIDVNISIEQPLFGPKNNE